MSDNLPEPEPAALPRARAGIALALLAMLSAYFFSYFLRSAIPGTIFSELQADLSLSASAVTSLSAMFIYIYGGMQLFVGLAADRFGGKRTLLVGWTAMAVGACLFPLSHSLFALYATRALTGFGSSFMFLCLLKEIDRMFGNQRFAMLVGVVTAVGYLGAVAGALPFERLVAAYGWRNSLLGIDVGILLSLVAGVCVLGWKDSRQPVPSSRLFTPILKALANRRSWPLLFCGLVNFPIYFNLQSVIGKKFLEDFAGFASKTAAAIVLSMICITAAMSFASGAALKLTSHRRKPFMVGNGVLMLTATLLLLGGVCWGAPGWVFAAAYFLLASAMITSPANIATVRELNHPAFMAVAVAVLNGMTYIGAAIAGNISGAVLDLFHGRATQNISGHLVYPSAAYATLFAVFAGMLLVSLCVTIFFMPETHGVQSHSETPSAPKPEPESEPESEPAACG